MSATPLAADAPPDAPLLPQPSPGAGAPAATVALKHPRPFRAPRSLLVLGGTSEIALATARRLIARGTRTVWLAGRPSPALDAAAHALGALRGRGGRGVRVHTVSFDALALQDHASVLAGVFAQDTVDMALLAFGVFGDQGHDEAVPPAAVRVVQTNYTGAVSAALVCAAAMQEQGHGNLVVLSSVAGARARRDDFIYGSSKAGLDAFTQGLGDAMRGTGVRVMLVRPGDVRGTGPDAGGSRLAGRRSWFTSTPEEVATAVERGLRRRAETVWVPGRLCLAASVLRLLPRAAYRLLPPL
jgi:decaprenylphospho-beta-D-erythro-pentofuranosid-2-ulose 2-reductase